MENISVHRVTQKEGWEEEKKQENEDDEEDSKKVKCAEASRQTNELWIVREIFRSGCQDKCLKNRRISKSEFERVYS